MKEPDAFQVTYRIRASDLAEARTVAHDICIEQTVEFPEALIHEPFIRSHVFGKVTDLPWAVTFRQLICAHLAEIFIWNRTN